MANKLTPTWKLEGLSLTGVRDGGKTSSLPAAQACWMWQRRQPRGLRRGCRCKELPCATEQEPPEWLPQGEKWQEMLVESVCEVVG